MVAIFISYEQFWSATLFFLFEKKFSLSFCCWQEEERATVQCLFLFEFEYNTCTRLCVSLIATSFTFSLSLECIRLCLVALNCCSLLFTVGLKERGRETEKLHIFKMQPLYSFPFHFYFWVIQTLVPFQWSVFLLLCSVPKVGLTLSVILRLKIWEQCTGFSECCAFSHIFRQKNRQAVK